MNEDTSPPDAQVCALVVDDDADMRRLIANVLLEHGHLAVAASSAEEALSSLPHYTFQVAYLDHNLPGMEGMVLGKWLRRNNPFMEIALVTGSVDERLIDLCEQHDLVLIRKPFDVNELLELPARYVADAVARYASPTGPDDEFDLPLATYVEDLDTLFDLPTIPARIEQRLNQRIGAALASIRSVSRYTERERVVAYAGLLTARVLGIRLARTRDGRTLYEEYDVIMTERGRRTEFTEEEPESD